MANTGSYQAAHHCGSQSLLEPSLRKPATVATGVWATREHWGPMQSSAELSHPRGEATGVLAEFIPKRMVSLHTSACHTGGQGVSSSEESPQAEQCWQLEVGSVCTEESRAL